MRTALLSLALALTMPTVASAQSPTVVGPYHGQIPFNCELQNVGTGTDYPDPDADPFCVEFDKTNQNITDFGLVEFTAQEPARVAAAGDKCFYFQRDHWTGSVVQGQSPEVWNWDGNYFYDRARGVGGVSVRNFRIGGTPQDASPYVPPAYQPYVDPEGGGGVEVLLESDPDPTCASKVDTHEERDRVYANRPGASPCIEPGGGIRGRKIGRVKLGNKREAVRAKLGAPTYAKKRYDAWCLVGKGELRAGYTRRGRVQAILTSGSGQSMRGVSRGDRARRARARLDVRGDGHMRKVGRFLFVRSRPPRDVLVGVRHQRVRWILITDGDFSVAMLRHVP